MFLTQESRLKPSSTFLIKASTENSSRISVIILRQNKQGIARLKKLLGWIVLVRKTEFLCKQAPGLLRKSLKPQFVFFSDFALGFHVIHL